MKKILSIVLSLAIISSSVNSTCFAQKEKNIPVNETITAQLENLLNSNECKNQGKICKQLLDNASKYINKEDKDLHTGNDKTKMVRYSLFSLIFNLVKLVTVDMTELSIKLSFYTLMLLYAPSKGLVKLGFQVVAYIAKVIGRTPKAVLYMLKGKLSDSELEKQCKEFLEDMIPEMN